MNVEKKYYTPFSMLMYEEYTSLKEIFIKYTPLHTLSYAEYTSLCGTRCKAYTNTCTNTICQCTERKDMDEMHHYAERTIATIRHYAVSA